MVIHFAENFLLLFVYIVLESFHEAAISADLTCKQAPISPGFPHVRGHVYSSNRVVTGTGAGVFAAPIITSSTFSNSFKIEEDCTVPF
jgi:hypothetical protein